MAKEHVMLAASKPERYSLAKLFKFIYASVQWPMPSLFKKQKTDMIMPKKQ
jgi:hypothetical protein